MKKGKIKTRGKCNKQHIPPFAYEPSWGFWYKPDEKYLDYGGKSLKSRGDTPCPTRRDLKGSKSL